jgi:flagellar hook-basal body complex protein FliE
MSIPVGWAAQRLMQYTQAIAGGASGGGGLGGGSLPGAGGLAGGIGGSSSSRLSQLGLDGSEGVPLSPSVGGPSFTDTLKRAIGGVSEAQDVAHQSIDAFVRGEPIELHQVMAAQEEAGIALEMLIEVRNKFTEAYRSVINMQS